MQDSGIVLIQKKDSLLCDVVRQAIERVSDGPLWETEEPPLHQAAGCGGALVLWDMWGFDGQQRDAWLEALAPTEIGVVLAVSAWDQSLDEVMGQLEPLGLITPNLSAVMAGTILNLAQGIHQHICKLLDQRSDLERQLEERLVIERAKSVVMTVHGLSEAEAMRRMQKRARDTNQKLIQVAKEILSAYHIFNGEPHEK